MCRTQCLLAFVALSINFAYSWDIALTLGDQLQFYSNGNKTSNKEDARFRDLTALTYDAVFNILLFVDKKNDNAIFSYNLTSNKINPLVKRKSFKNIQGIAFDPVTGLLFWTDSDEKTIYYKSLLRSATKDDFNGRLFLKMDDEIPRAIAVDSCRGYIYWTNINTMKPTIERAKFDGSEREIVIDSELYCPVSIAIDQRTNTLFWADDDEGINYSIYRSDLDGKNRNKLISGIHHQPNSIAVSKDSVYWVDFGFKSVWQFPKVPQENTKKLVALAHFNSEMPFAVVANYNVADQTERVPECKKLAMMSKNSTVIDEAINIPTDEGVSCLYGVAVAGQDACNCTVGYKGERCEISVCQNYCFDGDCNLTPEGEPVCRCKAGYTGSRCEVDVCRNQCLNEGRCSVVEERPICSCPEEFEGPRCEISKTKQEQNCTKDNSTTHVAPVPKSNDGEFVQLPCVYGWDPIRDPVLMVLGVISGLLCMACAVLITKIMKLNKRPRIKKRIIVNKNVTPLTARPDQCEITIENCCNMNICETPCFEPRSTIRPTLLDSKPGKEEKKNLIANMEYPDDY